MFHKMPFILIVVIIAVLSLNQFIPFEIKQILYATSLTIKSVIILVLPFVIFSLLFKTAVGLAQRATAVIGLIVLLVCCSNATSTFLSHYVGEWIYRFDLSLILPKDTQGLMPAWSWTFPKLIPNNIAMLLGVVLGIVLARTIPARAHRAANILDGIVANILKGFTCVIPIFVTGFIIKLQSDGVMDTIIKDYAMIFVCVALALYGYIIFGYILLNRFRVGSVLRSIKNMLPAAITGFSTMSSAAAMPLTIAGVERNAKNKDLARSVVPVTVNIHLVGDCFAIPIFAYAVMKSYGMAEPALMEYLIFIFYFVVAKFSVAAIPGGGIIVMLPILESCFGFNAEMLSLITALYILFDPVITCANVLGNAAFASLLDKLTSLRAKKTEVVDGEVHPI